MAAGLLAGLSRSELAALRIIHQRGQATRGDVAAGLGLSMAMAARLAARLLAAGLVREAGRSVVSGPGRQALLLEVNPDASYVIGVDIGTEMVHVLVADLQGAPRAYHEASSGVFAGKSQQEIVVAIAALVREAIASAALPLEDVAAVGVALTGIIDSEGGFCVMRTHTPGWEHFALVERLQAALGLPVVLEETARAKAVAELRLGAARGQQHFMYVDAGMAIGAGIVIDGRPYRGIGGLAGELGHVTVDPTGALCRCGNRGCVQATASARALVAQARDLLQQGVFSALARFDGALTIADVAAAAEQGDKLALGLLTEAGERLGEAISMALNLLGMDLIVVGGTLVHYSPRVLDAAARIVQLRVLPMVPRQLSLVPSTLGSGAAARGVVLQAIDRLLDASLDGLEHDLDAAEESATSAGVASR